MLHLPSGGSGLTGYKMAVPEIGFRPPSSQQKQIHPIMELSKPSVLKRKHADAFAADGPLFETRHRKSSPTSVSPLPAFATTNAKAPVASLPAANPIQHSPEESSTAKSKRSMAKKPVRIEAQQLHPITETQYNKMRRTIDTQLGLEILLKHKEHRLIDQEIAKCQIALEQLRRCREIPFPNSQLSQDVSQGRGPSVRSSRLVAQPASPAPWGVNNGPYSRHYAQWLLHDPLFEGEEHARNVRHTINAPTGSTASTCRSTRAHVAEPSGNASSKVRVQRLAKLQALPSGYPPPKDKSGPMIQKRKSDGSVVKLVCLDCRRENFSSTQGFINHCRIAHGRSFASHDAAADACGELVDINHVAGPVASELHGPSSARPRQSLNSHAHDRPLEATGKFSGSDSRPTGELSPALSQFPAVECARRSPATSSPTTPHLSALLDNSGRRIDLQGLVADAKMPIPVDGDLDGEDVDVEAEPQQFLPCGRRPAPHTPARLTRLPKSSNVNSKTEGKKRPSHVYRAPHTQSSSDGAIKASMATEPFPVPPILEVSSDGLEPSPTNDSIQAPSLVDDDDGEDDFEVPSPGYPASAISENEHRDVAINIANGEPADQSSHASPPATDYQKDSALDSSSSSYVQSVSAVQRSVASRGPKHVNFISPPTAHRPELETRRADESPGRSRLYSR